PTHALQYADRLRYMELPAGAEGWFAVPSFEGVARTHFYGLEQSDKKYSKVLRMLLTLMGVTYFYDDIDRLNVEAGLVTVRPHTSRAIHWTGAKQLGDIHIIAAQLGELRRGQSVEFTRHNLMKEGTP